MAGAGKQAVVAPNGKARTARAIDVRNPATGAHVASVKTVSAAAIAEFAQRGRAAQPEWSALGFDGRGAILARLRHWLRSVCARCVQTSAQRQSASAALKERRPSRASAMSGMAPCL